MELGCFLNSNLIFHRLQAPSKKRLIEKIAERINQQHPSLDGDLIFERLFARERLGSTALGEGTAIPHCRLELNDIPTKIIGAFVTLEQPIDFDAIDQQPVDLFCFLIAIGKQQQLHLDALASINNIFIDINKRTQLRQCNSVEALVKLLVL